MPQKNSMFDIVKFCNGERSTCNNIGYSKVVTSGNDPSLSNKMQFSQMLRSRRFKKVTTTNKDVPVGKKDPDEIFPLHLFPGGYIHTRSTL
jgi:hypothetical protein